MGAPGRAQRTPKGPPKTPLGHRGAAKTAPHKNSEPLNKKRRGQEKDNKNTPQIRSPFTRVWCSCPSGGLFWRRRGAKKTQKPSFYCSFGPKGCQNVRKPCILRGFVNTRLSQRRHSAQIYVVICGLVLHWVPARNRKTRTKTGLKVVVTLVCLLGPRSSPRGCPERANKPPEDRKTRRTAGIFKKLLKTSFLKMCTPLECQAHFGQKGSPTERQSPRTAVFFVVASKVARGSQKGERAHPQVF